MPVSAVKPKLQGKRKRGEFTSLERSDRRGREREEERLDLYFATTTSPLAFPLHFHQTANIHPTTPLARAGSTLDSCIRLCVWHLSIHSNCLSLKCRSLVRTSDLSRKCRATRPAARHYHWQTRMPFTKSLRIHIRGNQA